MCTQESDKRTEDWQTKTQITQSLAIGANDALRIVSNLFIVLLTICAFVFITVLPITQEDLLRGSVSFTLPLFQADISLKPFLLFSPWVIIGLHFYLLIQLRLALPKVRQFESTLNSIFKDEDLQQYLHNAPLAQLIVGSWQEDKLTHFSLHLISLFTLVFLPGITVLFMELRFLDFRETWIFVSQSLAQAVDFVLIVFLWPRIMSSKYDHVLTPTQIVLVNNKIQG
uniref:Uncharacterized protein n=1 Tax=Candidatus Kentrum sp. LPFa TaxID=2126335 RepID=A0A450WCY7_9GAMM|nr:MAG: hypothetical protein BECKLPF1236B_GA0070989_10699 [Candidatus Kentron sp. LPFa]